MSESERERIVSLPCGEGRIGLARCPGLDARADLRTDIAKIQAWGATAIVTGLSEREMSGLGLGDIGERSGAGCGLLLERFRRVAG